MNPAPPRIIFWGATWTGVLPSSSTFWGGSVKIDSPPFPSPFRWTVLGIFSTKILHTFEKTDKRQRWLLPDSLISGVSPFPTFLHRRAFIEMPFYFFTWNRVNGKWDIRHFSSTPLLLSRQGVANRSEGWERERPGEHGWFRKKSAGLWELLGFFQTAQNVLQKRSAAVYFVQIPRIIIHASKTLS